jgi:hypothetical protein
VDYLVAQSNVIAAVAGGREDIGSVRRWLLEGTASFFGGASSVSFTFGGPLAILQPIMWLRSPHPRRLPGRFTHREVDG